MGSRIITHLQRIVRDQRKVIKQLAEFHEATMDALARQKQGHSDGWTKVVELSDKIEDNFDLTSFTED